MRHNCHTSSAWIPPQIIPSIFPHFRLVWRHFLGNEIIVTYLWEPSVFKAFGFGTSCSKEHEYIAKCGMSDPRVCNILLVSVTKISLSRSVSSQLQRRSPTLEPKDVIMFCQLRAIARPWGAVIDIVRSNDGIVVYMGKKKTQGSRSVASSTTDLAYLTRDRTPICIVTIRSLAVLLVTLRGALVHVPPDLSDVVLSTRILRCKRISWSYNYLNIFSRTKSNRSNCPYRCHSFVLFLLGEPFQFWKIKILRTLKINKTKTKCSETRLRLPKTKRKFTRNTFKRSATELNSLK
jgi:hypothetical protein